MRMRMRREKKGVAGIIAGVFIAAILFSSVAIFFLTILEGENTRNKAEIGAQNYQDQKLKETFKIRSEEQLTSDSKVQVRINNTGPIPLASSYLIMYDTDGVPIDNGESLNGLTVNAGTNTLVNYTTPLIPPVYDPTGNTTYSIDLISERGNIQTTTWPPPPFATAAAEAALAQQTGSVILNYTGFGAIFPNFGSIDGVDQTGWSVKIKDTPGYPAFLLIDDELTYLTARVKNKDFSGYDMDLLHYTGFVLTSDEGTSFGQKAVYICDTDYVAKTVSQYSDITPIRLPNDNNFPVAQWVNITFCDTDIDPAKFPLDQNKGLKPGASDVNFLFMILRGTFVDGRPYAQTIPYQAVLIAEVTGGPLLGLLKNPADNTAKYLGFAGEQVKVEIVGGNPSFDIHWIYPTGNYLHLDRTSAVSTTINIPLEMPPPNDESVWGDPACFPDPITGTPPDWDACPWIPLASGNYIIQLTDAVDHVHYLTFEVL